MDYAYIPRSTPKTIAEIYIQYIVEKQGILNDFQIIAIYSITPENRYWRFKKTIKKNGKPAFEKGLL